MVGLKAHPAIILLQEWRIYVHLLDKYPWF